MNDVTRNSIQLSETLDAAADLLRHEDAHGALQVLCEFLLPVRLRMDDAAWESSVREPCLSHPVRELFHLCPLTKRAFDKPRGYAGDAEMLDMIYFQCPPTTLSAVALALFRAVSRLSTGSSVAFRRDYMANQIDEVASIRHDISVLSLGCGHLRETDRSISVADGRVARFVAADQDQASLSYLEKAKPCPAIEPMLVSVKQLIAGRDIGTFDLIYSGGLFDYLPDRVAIPLVGRLRSMLKPGGRLIVGNFTPDNYGRPYMETFMDWRLILRSPEDMARLGHSSGPQGSLRVFVDPFGGIAYLQFQRGTSP